MDKFYRVINLKIRYSLRDLDIFYAEDKDIRKMVDAGGSGAGRIVVAETGNKRREISNEDVMQCVKDLAGWFQSNAAAHYESKMAPVANSASEDQIRGVLSEFSAGQCSHLVMSLQKFNGGLHYDDTYIGLSLDQINEIGSAKGLKGKKQVPFASDIDGSFLCLQISDDGASDMVISVDGDGEMQEQMTVSYGQYLEEIRQKLLTRKLVYEDGLGLVSVA